MIVTIFFSFYSHTRCFLLCCGPLSSVALPSAFIFLLSFFHPPLLRHSIIHLLCFFRHLQFSSISLFPVSYLRLLQALLDTDLASEVVCLTSGPGLVGLRPLGVEDGALYPLGSRGAQCLSIALSGLLLQVLACLNMSRFVLIW